MRTCTGSSTSTHRGGAASCSSTPAQGLPQLVRLLVNESEEHLVVLAVEVHSVDMNAANQLVALEDAVLAHGHAMTAHHIPNCS